MSDRCTCGHLNETCTREPGNSWPERATAAVDPPARMKRIPMSNEGRANVAARLAAEPHPVDKIPWPAERATAAVDVERLARVLRYSPMHWEVRRPDGAFVMTRMFESADEAAAAIAAEYARLSGESE